MTIHTVKGLEIHEWVARAEAAEAERAEQRELNLQTIELLRESEDEVARLREALREIANGGEGDIPADLSCGCYGDSGPYIVYCDKHGPIGVARAALASNEEEGG
jgi:hypothetical protein